MLISLQHERATHLYEDRVAIVKMPVPSDEVPKDDKVLKSIAEAGCLFQALITPSVNNKALGPQLLRLLDSWF